LQIISELCNEHGELSEASTCPRELLGSNLADVVDVKTN